MSKTLNLYGDIKSKQFELEGCGVDISSQRFDRLDRACMQFVLSQEHASGLDLGCGLGKPSIAFAIAGAEITLVDKLDLNYRFEYFRREIPLPSLRFVRCDLKEIERVQPVEPLTFVYSQRTLHYLTYDDAIRVAQWAAARLVKNGRMFISASGLRSELAENYLGARQPIAHRFAKLAPHQAKNHNIFAEVCLYSERELTDLITPLGFSQISISTSEFGNIKAIFERI